MSSENKTPNIGLNQWQGNEYAKREDFVNDNLIIDRKIKELQIKTDEKVDKEPDKQLSTEDYTTDEKEKLANIQNEANKYVHPPSHPASIIVQDSTYRFVTDIEKNTWNSKEVPEGAQQKANIAEQNAKTYADSIKPTKVSQLENDTGYITTQRAVSDSTSSTSTSTAASSRAVKTAYDKANQAFQSASDGKSKLASAITGMGQNASGSDSFNTLSAKIKNISKDANAGTSNVLTGKTFYQGAVKRTGTMANRGSKTFTPNTSVQTAPSGYYNSIKVNSGLEYNVVEKIQNKLYTIIHKYANELNPNTLAIIKSANAFGFYPSGIGGIQDRLYGCAKNRYENILYEYNYNILLVINRLELSESSMPSGIGGIQNRLYTCIVHSDIIYELNLNTLAFINHARSPDNSPASIGGTQYRLYHGDYGVNKNYELNPSTLAIIKSIKPVHRIPNIGGTQNRLYGSNSKYIYELNPNTLAIIKDINISSSDLGGIFPIMKILNIVTSVSDIDEIKFDSQTYVRIVKI